MKKYIVIRLMVVVLVITAILLSIGAYSMLHASYIGFHSEASNQIKQIETILAENDSMVERLQDDLKEDFLIRAKAAAYMLQYNPDIIYDIEQLEYIIALLQIDEIHLFTPEGEIYSGNIPEYYGYNMNSGEQMSFFLPLLDDYNLALAQDVTPNTAEGKEMQYVAVWSDDRKHIVQIGIEPIRLLNAMRETSHSYIFSRLTHSEHTVFFTADSTTGEIISSTSQSINGSNLCDFGLKDLDGEDAGLTHTAKIDDEYGHVLFLKQSDNIFIGYFETYSSTYNPTLVSIAFLFGISFAVAFIIIVVLYILLDRVVLHGLIEIEQGIALIANGNLEYKMAVTGLPEFQSLSNNVNFMVKRVVESSRKFSTIFEHIKVPIAMYECNTDAVIATGNLAEILSLTQEQFEKDFKSPSAFLSYVEKIMSHPHSSESDLYALLTDKEVRFLKIMRYQDGESDWGLIIDSTDEINEKNIIKKERDTDFLTGLYGKRAYFKKINSLSHRQNDIKKAAVLMFDLDNLKYVNDTWGHETGDKFIATAATVLQSCKYDHKICARLSGDEFSMILYGSKNYSALETEIQNITEQFDKTYITTPTGENHKVSSSIGYSLYPEQSESLSKCLSYADKAMYSAKSKCKGSVEKYNIAQHIDASEQHDSLHI